MEYTRKITYALPDIDKEVAELCHRLGETIICKARWESHLNTYVLRVEADIYGLEREEIVEKRGLFAGMAYDTYQNSEVDLESRYDSDFNWEGLDADKDVANEILRAYVAHQQKLYPGCVFETEEA